MVSINRKNRIGTKTHEGGAGRTFDALTELKRSVFNTMLFQDEFYENGESISERIQRNANKVGLTDLAELAKEARHKHGIRHAPLLLLLAMARRGGSSIVSETIANVISRPDEITELVALYWKDGKHPLSKQMKLGLAEAFHKFDEYQFAKWDNRRKAVRLRDVMFLVHPKPRNRKEEGVFRRIADDCMKTPDTWEVNLSAGADKKETFERLLRERKLGYLALLRNLRNMEQAGVDRKLVEDALVNGNKRGILPWQFVTAYRNSNSYKRALNKAFKMALGDMEPFDGRTLILVDVSGSMLWNGGRSSVSNMDYAAALAVAFPGEKVVYSFSNKVVEVPVNDSLKSVDAIIHSQSNMGTYLGDAVKRVKRMEDYDRIIVITDEQVHDRVPDPGADKAYIINVAPYNVGIDDRGKWTRIDGRSFAVLDWMRVYEDLHG